MNDELLVGITEKFTEEVAKLVPEIYKDAGQPAIWKIGKTLGLLWDSCVHLRAVLYSAETRARLAPRIRQYLNEIAAIENDNLCEVPAQIGVPILERLTYVTDDDIADLFIRLLSSASSEETINLAHPRFVSLIDSISPDEARILTYLRGKKRLEFLQIRVPGVDEDKTLWGIPHRFCLKFPQNMRLYFNNLASLGIFADVQLSGELDELQDRRLLEIYGEEIAAATGRVTMAGYYITEFGKMFIRTCTAKLSSEEIAVPEPP